MNDIDAKDKSLHEVLSENQPILSVPPYQRSYEWPVYLIEGLFNDLWDAAFEEDSDEGTYFLGTIVLCPVGKKRNELQVIDGQQRLTTLTILIAVIRDLLERIDGKEANRYDQVINRYDGRHQDYLPILTLNVEQDRYLKEQILCESTKREKWDDGRGKRPGPKPRNFLQICYNTIKRRLEEEVHDKKDNFKRERFVEFGNFVLYQTKIVRVIVSTESGAFGVFENLNSKSLGLSVSDLIKNRVFLQAAKFNGFEEAMEAWENLTDQLKRYFSESKAFSKFLRYYWLSNHGLVTMRQLFGAVATHVESKKSKREVIHFIKDIQSSATHYGDVLAPTEQEEWAEDLVDFGSIGITQHIPLLMAALKRDFPDKDYLRLVRAIETLAVRSLIIGGRVANQLEANYHSWAKSIRDEGKDSLNDVIKKMAKICEDDNIFKSQFEVAEIPVASQARYLLRKLEYHRAGKERKINSSKIVEVEHILPQSPDEVWLKKWSQEEIEKYVYRLGNQTLLSVAINRSIKNGAFEKKKEDYKKSKLISITNDVREGFSEWTAESVIKRQKDFALDALKIWKF